MSDTKEVCNAVVRTVGHARIRVGNELKHDSPILFLQPLAALGDECALNINALEPQRRLSRARQPQRVWLEQSASVGAEAGNVDVEPLGFARGGELGRVKRRQVVAHVGAAVDAGEEVVVVDPAGGVGDHLHGHVCAVDEYGDRVAGPGGRLVELGVRPRGAGGGEEPAASELGRQSVRLRRSGRASRQAGSGGRLTLKRAGWVCGFISSFSGRSYLGSKDVLWVPVIPSWAAAAAARNSGGSSRDSAVFMV